MPNPARTSVLAATAAVALIALAGCSGSSGSSSTTTSAGTPAQTKAASTAEPSIPSGSSTAASGLTLGTAEAACKLAGVRTYPYGFEPHWSLGFVSADASSGAWVIKAHADVAEEQGKASDRVVTCTVNGTDDAPEVTSITLG